MMRMPTYEYECLKCKSRFEIFQKMSDPPVKKCLKCNGNLRRLIGTGAGLIFKGSGFYITDYKYNQSHTKNSKNQKSTSSKTENKEKSPKEKPTNKDKD